MLSSTFHWLFRLKYISNLTLLYSLVPEPVQYIYSPIPNIPKTYKPSLLRKKSPKQEPDGEQKRGMITAF